ncbi:hypothetical protein CJF30_00001437 [Rutstroemia sp. NJR-2017a BBW]|nr:hypothetical protein CJF30_00001437 [Rutstroemia sp. NJR-2017a BBW]
MLIRSLWLVVAAVGIAQGYKYEPRGLSDIIAALEGANGKQHGGQSQVTKEITKTMTVTKAAPATLGTAAVLGTGNVQTVTVTAAGLNMTQVETVTEQVTQMVTQVITQMVTQMVTSMVTVTMMQTVPGKKILLGK